MDFTEAGKLLLLSAGALGCLGVLTSPVSRLADAACELVAAYKDRTKMIGDQFAETRREQARVHAAMEAVERNRPQTISFEQQVKEMQREAVERIQRNARMQQDAAASTAQARHHEHGTSSAQPGRTTLPPVSR